MRDPSSITSNLEWVQQVALLRSFLIAPCRLVYRSMYGPCRLGRWVPKSTRWTLSPGCSRHLQLPLQLYFAHGLGGFTGASR